MASNIGLPEGFEVEYTPNGLPEGFDVEYAPTIKKGIDISPRVIGQTLGNLVATPIVAQKEKLPLKEAYNIATQRTEDFNNEPINKVGNAIGDFALYSAMPVIKAAQGAGALSNAGKFLLNNKGANFLTTAAIQGGVPGLIEGAKEGNALGGGLTGTTIASAVQGLPGIAKLGGWTFKHTFPGLKAKTVEQLIKPNSKALDLTEETAQNLLMDTTERIQKDYKDLLSQRGKTVGEAIKALPADKGIARQDLKDVLENIYNDFSASGNQALNVARNEAGGLYKYANNLIDKSKNNIVSASEVKDILKNVKSHAPKDVLGNPISSEEDAIINLLYGDYNAKLSTLSPELAQANKSYKALKDFEQNEGIKEIIRPNKKNPQYDLDKASRALRNYNSTITSGNKNRNIQDLEQLFIKEGYQPFLKDIDDVNAANELLKTAENGFNPAGLTDKFKNIVERPILLGARKYNQVVEPIINNLSDKISPEVRRLLTPFAIQKTTPMLYGEVSNY